MLLYLLVACYDELVVHAKVDVPANRVAGETRIVNLWRNYVTCEDTPTCTAAFQQEVANSTGVLKEKGASEARAYLTIHEGLVDLVVHWALPLQGMTYDNQSFLLLSEGPGRGVLDPARRKPRAAFVFNEDRNTRVIVKKAPLGTRVWSLPDTPDRSGILLPGPRGEVEVAFVTLDDGLAVAHGEPWVSTFVGLEEALRAIPGLVVDE